MSSRARSEMQAYIVGRNKKHPDQIKLIGRIPDDDLRRFKVVRNGKINLNTLAGAASMLNEDDLGKYNISVALLSPTAFNISIAANQEDIPSTVDQYAPEDQSSVADPTVTSVEIVDDIPEEENEDLDDEITDDTILDPDFDDEEEDEDPEGSIPMEEDEYDDLPDLDEEYTAEAL